MGEENQNSPFLHSKTTRLYPISWPKNFGSIDFANFRSQKSLGGRILKILLPNKR